MTPRPFSRFLLLSGTAALTLIVSTAAISSPSARKAEAYEAFRAQSLRVARVGYALANRNRELCGKALAPQSGIVLNGPDPYEPGRRRRLAAHFVLADASAVLGVVPGSPGERAGLRADDTLVAINGRPLGLADAGDRAGSHHAAEQASVVLAAEMARGEVRLRYRRAGLEDEAILSPVQGCRSRIAILPGGSLNAWANGTDVIVGEALLAASRNDDDLAFVIAHELAHNILRATTGETPGREAELAADRLGLALVTGAGYDPARALTTWRPVIYKAGTSRTHPSAEVRVAAIVRGIAENR